MIETAEGDASRFRQVLVEYTKAPAVTRDRLYIDTMQQVFSNTSKVMVDCKQTATLLYLPLDKLMQQALQDVRRRAHQRRPRRRSPLRYPRRAVARICARAIATRGERRR